MDRRKLVEGGSATIILTTLGLSDLAEAGSTIRVPIASAVRIGKTLEDMKRRVFNLRRDWSIQNALNVLANRQDRLVVTGINPIWENPEQYNGLQLLQLDSWRNSDMEPVEPYPSQAITGQWWMIFVGPSKYLDRHRRAKDLDPIELLRPEFILQGPHDSVTTTKLDRFQLDRRRWCSPQVFLLNTLPNGPW